jgi:hypothetical protein
MEDWAALRENLPDLLAEREKYPERVRRDLDYTVAGNILGHPVASLSQAALRASEGDALDEAQLVGKSLSNAATSANRDMTEYVQALRPSEEKWTPQKHLAYAAAYPWMFGDAAREAGRALWGKLTGPSKGKPILEKDLERYRQGVTPSAEYPG